MISILNKPCFVTNFFFAFVSNIVVYAVFMYAVCTYFSFSYHAVNKVHYNKKMTFAIFKQLCAQYLPNDRHTS